MVYSLVDSKGNSLSNPSRAKVLAGESACLPPRPDPRRLEVTNVIPKNLTTLSTCSPLSVHVDGGQKPYTVSLVPIDVAPVINITLGVNHDSLYWLNVLQPNTTFLVAASDRSVLLGHGLVVYIELVLTYIRNSQGLYGYSEAFVTSGTNGTTDCSDHVTGTHSFNSRDAFGQKSNTTSIAAAATGGSSPNVTNGTENGNNTNGQNDGGRTAGIVGGTMGAIILLGLLFILYRHRKRHQRDDEHVADLIPDLVPINHSTPGESMNQIGVSSTSFGHFQSLQSTSSPGQVGVTGAGMNDTSRKAARRAEEQGVPAPTSMDRGSGVQVRQHPDTMGIMELPPAYRDASL